MFLCPVPENECSGGKKTVSQTRNKAGKVHNTQQDLQRYIKRYMEKKGYTRGRNREYTKDGMPTIVISKKAGSRLRRGKSAEGAKSSSRMMLPSRHRVLIDSTVV